jgi:hypothetical protein
MTIPPLIRLAAAAFFLAISVAGGAATSAPRAAEGEGNQAPAIAAAIDLANEGAKARLTVALSRPVVARAHAMERPDRVIVDLAEVTFHIAGETARKRDGLGSSRPVVRGW